MHITHPVPANPCCGAKHRNSGVLEVFLFFNEFRLERGVKRPFAQFIRSMNFKVILFLTTVVVPLSSITHQMTLNRTHIYTHTDRNPLPYDHMVDVLRKYRLFRNGAFFTTFTMLL